MQILLFPTNDMDSSCHSSLQVDSDLTDDLKISEAYGITGLVNSILFIYWVCISVAYIKNSQNYGYPNSASKRVTDCIAAFLEKTGIAGNLFLIFL